MVSLPLIPNNASVSSLFPDAVVVYGFEKNSGYVRIAPEENLKIGSGYWILFDNPQSYNLTGEVLTGYGLPFYENGWYLIGGCSSPSEISVDYCNIDVIYDYVPGSGYQELLGSDSLMHGKGYWILFSEIMNQCDLSVEAK